MFYNVIGNLKGEVYVFLHGWGADSSVFRRVIFALPKNISVLLIDFWGFGKTGEPNRPLTVYDFADEVVDIINSLGITSFSIVGHSFGGRIGIIIASKLNSRVKKLVLVDSAGVVPRRSLLFKLKVKRYKRLKKNVLDGKLSADVLAKYGSDDYRVLSPVMKETFVNVVNEDLVPLAKNIVSKTYLIWGEKDNDTPLYMAKKLNKVIAGSSLCVLKDAGHYCFLDKFEDFVYYLYDSILFN